MSGAQSPPLEATGEHTTMGASSVDNPQEVQVVADADQRKEYFKGDAAPADKDKPSGTKPAFKAQTMGSRLAEEGRQID